jgi:prepilin-type N-terminal cleavage/methylation domain-containing protein
MTPTWATRPPTEHRWRAAPPLHAARLPRPALVAGGFTLVEMLVVLVLAGLLTGVVMPAMVRVVSNAQQRAQHDAITGRINELGYEAYASGRSIVLSDSNKAARKAANNDSDPKVMDAAAPETTQANATGEYPVELPEGWRIKMRKPVVWAFTGICDGGTLTLVAPDRSEERFELNAPFCKVAGGG